MTSKSLDNLIGAAYSSGTGFLLYFVRVSIQQVEVRNNNPSSITRMATRDYKIEQRWTRATFGEPFRWESLDTRV